MVSGRDRFEEHPVESHQVLRRRKRVEPKWATRRVHHRRVRQHDSGSSSANVQGDARSSGPRQDVLTIRVDDAPPPRSNGGRSDGEVIVTNRSIPPGEPVVNGRSDVNVWARVDALVKADSLIKVPAASISVHRELLIRRHTRPMMPGATDIHAHGR